MITYTRDRLTEIFGLHQLYLRGDSEGIRADLSGADLRRAVLRRADLSGADLSGADLRRADLSGAVLSDAVLSGAVLRRADLSGAVLSGAVLSGAVLSGAVLRRADLSQTCLDPDLHKVQRERARSQNRRGIITYRTEYSRHVGNTRYLPGHTYIAPHLSFDTSTDCHPGIYAGSLDAVRSVYPDQAHRIVKCYIRAGDFVETSKIAPNGTKFIRCERLRVLSYVE